MSGKLRKADYPSNWNVLRAMVRLRADDACECRGECGETHVNERCLAPNHVMIIRDIGWPARWWMASDPLVETFTMPYKRVRVVLTIAHLCHDSTCDNVEHLRAMCQRCHLKLDVPQHAAHAAQTRYQAQIAVGQLVLL